MAKALYRTVITSIPNFRDFTGASARSDALYVGYKDGVTVDAFRSKIREGIDASSGYTMDAVKVIDAVPFHSTLYYQEFQSFPAGIRENKVVTNNGYYISIPGNGYAHRAVPSVLNEAESLSRLYSKIKSEFENFNSLVFLGELGETLRMLRNPASALLSNTSRFLSTVKSTRDEARRRIKPRKSDSAASLRNRRAQSVRDGIAGSWLEYQFGLVPLMSDVKDIAETAARALVGKPSLSRVSSRSSNTLGSATIVNGSGAFGATCNRFTYSRKDDSIANVAYTAGLRSHLTGPAQSLSDLAVLSGVSLSNFIPTAYQLMPYSFLIDYFSNLGDVLEAWCTDTSSVVYFTKTVKQVTTIQVTESNYPEAQYSIGALVPTAFVGQAQSRRFLTRTTLTRSRGTTLPIPPLIGKIPGIDSKKWFNMAALIAQTRAFR